MNVPKDSRRADERGVDGRALNALFITVSVALAGACFSDPGPNESSETQGNATANSSGSSDSSIATTIADGACGVADPGVGGCPVQCTGGCDDGNCRIDCSDANCRDATVECPDGWPCLVACAGLQSCRDTTVICSDGVCVLDCSGTSACLRTNVTCGPQACIVNCDGGAYELGAIECGPACACAEVSSCS